MSFLQKAILVVMVVTVSFAHAVVFSVDVRTDLAGVQNIRTVRGGDSIVVVEFRIANSSNLYSYQFAVQYDTTKLRYLAGDKDYGFIGTHNILSANGGTIQGLAQKRLNPPRPDIIDFAYTITGTNVNQQVSGPGLIGLAYFKHTMANGDSTSLQLISGAWASLNGSLNVVDSLNAATVKIAVPCTLTISSIGTGTTTPSGTVFAFVGDTIPIKAHAGTGFVFDSWSVTDSAMVLDTLLDSTGIICSGTHASVQAQFNGITTIARPGIVVDTRKVKASNVELFDIRGRCVGNVQNRVVDLHSSSGIYIYRQHNVCTVKNIKKAGSILPGF